MQDKIAIVASAGRGIGRVIAAQLARGRKEGRKYQE